MADLTRAVEIAAKAMYEQDSRRSNGPTLDWSTAPPKVQRLWRGEASPIVAATTALANAGLLKENTDG